MSEIKLPQVSPLLDDKEIINVTQSLEDQWLTEGQFTKAFCNKIKDITSAKYVLPAPNGTLGLFLAILSLKLPPKSEIIIPSFTFFGSASSVIFAGHIPKFVDVCLDDYTLDPKELLKNISSKTKAIMAVHIYGQIAKLDQIKKICDDNNLILIEDAAQAIGVSFDGKHAGTIGKVGVISFFADKTITTGEGAVLLTNDDNLYETIKLIRNQGRPNSGTFIHPELGMNFRITDIQAGVGLAQLQKLEKVKNQRLATLKLYKDALSDIKDIKFMNIDPKSTFIPFRAAFTSSRKEEIVKALEGSGIQTRSFFYPMHLQPSLKDFVTSQISCSNSEKLFEMGTALPVHSRVSENDVYNIRDLIKKIY